MNSNARWMSFFSIYNCQLSIIMEMNLSILSLLWDMKQWQSIYNRLNVIKSFSSQLIIAKHTHNYTNAYTHSIVLFIRFVWNKSNNNSCYHYYLVAKAVQKSLFYIYVSSKWMNDWSQVIFNISIHVANKS
jgi:hypothetical protein